MHIKAAKTGVSLLFLKKHLGLSHLKIYFLQEKQICPLGVFSFQCSSLINITTHITEESEDVTVTWTAQWLWRLFFEYKFTGLMPSINVLLDNSSLHMQNICRFCKKSR